MTDTASTPATHDQASELLSTVAFAASRLLRQGPSGVPLAEVLERVGRAAAASLVVLYRNATGDLGQPVSRLESAWAAPGRGRPEDDPALRELAHAEPGMRLVVGPFGKGQAAYADVARLPPHERTTFERFGVTRIAAAPVFCGGSWWGFLGLDQSRSQRRWRSDTIAMLRSVADIVGATLEHRRAEETLRESEERHRSIVAALGEGVTLYDEPGRIRSVVNDAACRILRIPREAILAWTPEAGRGHLVREDGSPFPVDELPSSVTFRTGEPCSDVVMGVQHPVCGMLWISVNSQPLVRPGESMPHSVVTSFTDVTEKRRDAETLRRQNAFLAALQETTLALMDRFELGEVLEAIVERAVSLLGADYGALFVADPGSETLELRYAVKSKQPAVGTRLRRGEAVSGRVWASGRTLRIDDYQGWEGRVFPSWRAVLGVPIRVGGEVTGVLTLANEEPGRTFSDADVELLERLAHMAGLALDNSRLVSGLKREVEERRRAEEALRLLAGELEQRVLARTAELRSANAELERAAKTKDEFLASTSHELRTPLNAILGLSEALLEGIHGPLAARQARSLRILEQSARHLLALINDILDLSKIEAGRLTLSPEQVGVASLCAASLDLVGQAALEKRITLREVLDPAARSVRADPKRLKQVLVNLLANAVKFTPEGGTVTLETEADAGGEAIRLRVKDTGIGIPADQRLRLFQPFVQLDSSLSRRHAGTGLGLALVQRLTALHGGGVSLDSEPGAGSAFTVSLPWKPAQADADPPEDPAADEVAAPPRRRPDGSAPRLLLVEDSEATVEAVSAYLEARGYRVATARTGVEAIASASSLPPDLILMDIQMPGMDGLEATRRIRQDHAQAGVPILALTALAMTGDRERCLAAGADDFLTKPVSLKGLVRRIEELRARRDRREA